jgi:beta-glucanase (GH16 family)
MRFNILSIYFLLFLGHVRGQICDGKKAILIEEAVCNTNDWVLQFEDNFETSQLDTSKWSIPYQGVIRDFEFNKEKQWYINTGSSPKIELNNNIEIANGLLRIIGKREIPPIKGSYVSNYSVTPWKVENEMFNFSSAQIASNAEFGYGKYETRCKIPKGYGFWPAFWLYGVSAGNNSSEIDIFEFWDDNTCNHNMNVHFNHKMCLTDYNATDFSEDFHVFTLIWDNFKIEWYVDGNLKRRNTKFNTLLGQQLDCEQLKKDQTYIVDKNYPLEKVNIILNLAIQNDKYKPNQSTIFPGIFEVDYVRYYSK